ncbi:MAG: hypothetical protein ACREFF_12800 [Candidatus Udaeobacter sp.]
MKISHLLLLFILLGTGWTYGHGFAGSRFFPATLSTDDPFVADELSLPTVSSIVTPDDGGTRETDISSDIALRITPKWDIEFGETLITLNPAHGKAVNGFDNLSIGSKYEFFENDEHEAVISLGLDVDVGGTGSNQVADPFTTWTPGIFFGKGFGDLPQQFSLMKPLAITGVVAVAIPSSASTEGEPDPAALQLGFAFEYSLIYLQEQIKDIGLRAPFDRLIPLVEVAIDDPLNRGQSGLITGTVNPGIIWSGKYVQVGAEAIIPINSRTGNDVGFIAQLHFYLDDLFPHSIGRPLFGGNK